MSIQTDPRPIGLFDSGAGGLTVLKRLIEYFPDQNYLYLGDTARLPYGSKSHETIYKYSHQILNYLIEQNVKMIVIACNSASSTWSESVFKDRPVVNVIEPGAQLAYRISPLKRIGIVGTRTTVKSEAYVKQLKQIDPSLFVKQQACPLWVPFAEEGLVDDPLTNLIVYRYLHSLLSENIDTLILGCTHYPILINSITKAIGKETNIVESGLAVVDLLQNKFLFKTHPSNSPPCCHFKVKMTDSNDYFLQVARQILDPLQINHVEHVDL